MAVKRYLACLLAALATVLTPLFAPPPASAGRFASQNIKPAKKGGAAVASAYSIVGTRTIAGRDIEFIIMASDPNPDTPVTFRTTTAGSAMVDKDFEPQQDISFRFSAGQSRRIFRIRSYANSEINQNLTVGAEVGVDVEGVLTQRAAGVAILVQPQAPTLLSILGSPDVAEGDDLSFTVSHGGVPATSPIYVKLAFGGTEWLESPPPVVKIEPGETGARIKLHTRASAAQDGERRVTVTLVSADSGQIGFPRSATGIIMDDVGSPGSPVFSLVDPPTSLKPGDTFDVTRSGTSRGVYTVDYRLVGEGVGQDYDEEQHPKHVRFKNGDKVASIIVPDLGCTTKAMIAISNPQPNGRITSATATARYLDPLAASCELTWQEKFDRWYHGYHLWWEYLTLIAALLVVWLSLARAKRWWPFPVWPPFSVDGRIEYSETEAPLQPIDDAPLVEWATHVVIEPGDSGVSDSVEIVSKDIHDDR